MPNLLVFENLGSNETKEFLLTPPLALRLMALGSKKGSKQPFVGENCCKDPLIEAT